jgi:hypothetical protein
MQEANNKFLEVLGNAELGLYFAYLERCRGVEQMEIHHPEGNVLNHSLQCFHWAIRESTDIDLVLAALLHDIGKIKNSKGHEKIAVNWLMGVCSIKTLWLIEHHMRIWNLLLGQMRRKKKVAELVGHCWLPELISLARWDKMARNPNKEIKYNKENILIQLNECCDSHFQRATLK